MAKVKVWALRSFLGAEGLIARGTSLDVDEIRARELQQRGLVSLTKPKPKRKPRRPSGPSQTQQAPGPTETAGSNHGTMAPNPDATGDAGNQTPDPGSTGGQSSAVGTLDPDELMKLTKDNLLQLAVDMEVDVAPDATKADIVEAIVAVPVQTSSTD